MIGSENVAAEDEDLLRFKRWFREDYDARIEWAKEAVTDYAFHAGDGQWEEADRVRLKEQNRPCITFNRIMPVVSSVVGQEINQRAEVTYKPRTTQTPEQAQPGMGMGNSAQQGGMPVLPGVQGADDSGPAETLTAAAAYLRDQCDAEDEESDAFQDTVICGMGWVETRVTYDESPDGDLKEDRIDPLEMYWDCKAEKRNLSDMRRVFRVREIDKDDAKELFPDKDVSLLDASWARLTKNTQPHDREAARYYESENAEDFDPKRKTVTLVECQYYELKTTFKSVDFNTGGEVEFKSQKEADNYVKNVFTMSGGQAQLPVAKHRKRVYKTAIIGREVLSDEESQSQKAFKYQAITGYRDRNSKQWIGLVRAMRDPQRWANALFSSVLHQIQTTGKGIMAERDAFENQEQAEKDWANGSKIVWLNAGAIAGQKVVQKEQHALPQGVFDMMQMALSAFRDVTGVNIESMGLADRSQAASLEMQRTKQAGIILASLFDGLRRFRKENGRLILDLIRNFLSDGRLVRVVGPDYEQYVPLIKQDETIDYDIIVDESPSSPNQKEMSWAILQQLLPVLGKSLTPSTGSILLKASPLPLPVVNEFKKAAEKDAQAAARQPNPDMLKLQGEMQIKQMEAAQREKEGQQQMALTQQKGQIDMQLGQMNLQLKAIEVELAKFQAGIDLQRAQQDAQFKTQEMGFKQHEMQAKAHEGQVQREHDMKMRKMELSADAEGKEREMMGPQMPSMMDGIGKGLIAVAKALEQQGKSIADGQSEVAKALLTPKVATLNGDTAVVRPA